jgi:hypothetical protein
MASDSQPPVETDVAHCTDVERFLRIIHPDGVFEVRVIDCPDRKGGSFTSTVSGYFNDPSLAANAIGQVEAVEPPAVYVSVNPVADALLARANNRIIHRSKKTTSKGDVKRRRWLFIDVDAIREDGATGISSTDDELAAAMALSETLLGAMRAEGWPEPMRGMSGNGAYLFWRIDLPNDDAAESLIKRVLTAMADRFNTAGAEVDLSPFDANRICKVLGTVARKGDPIVGIPGLVDRPHRRSWFVDPGGELAPVTIDQLTAVAESIEDPEPAKSVKPSTVTHVRDWDADRWLRDHNVPVGEAMAYQGGRKWLFTDLPKCCEAHGHGFDGSSCIIERADGMMGASCRHNHCDWGWKELRRAYEPDAYSHEDVDLSAFLNGSSTNEPSGSSTNEPSNDGDDADAKVETGPAADDPWEDPLALPDPLLPVMAYESDLLPPAIGAAVDDIADRMQCPPDFPAASMLVALAAVIGCRIGIRPKRHDDWLVVPNLWGCVVGRPSLKKSPAIGHAERRVRAIEARERERLSTEVESFEVDQVLAEVSVKTIKSDIAKAIKAGDLDDARRLAMELKMAEELSPPIPRRIITTDSTIEKLGDMLNKYPFGMLLWVDELIGWMRGLDRPDMAGVRQQFLTLWNGQGRLNIDRLGRGETVVENPCLSVFGCATPGGIADYVAAALRGGRGDDGLIQRLQVLVWPDSPKAYRRVDRRPNSSARDGLVRVFEELADLEPSGFAQRDQFDEGGGLPWLRFDADGQAVFDAWDESVQNRIRSGEMPESFESHLSKYASMVPSIALVIHLVSGSRGPVSGSAARVAVRWANYLESHAARLYSIAVAPDRQMALPMLKRLVAWPSDKPIRARAIAKQNWSGLGEVEVVNSVLDLLIDLGWVRPLPIKPVNGRPTTDYVVHPRAADFLKTHQNGAPKTGETPGGGSFGGFAGSILEGSKQKNAPAERFKGVI